MTDRQNPQESGWLRSPTGLALLGFLAIAAFFLFTEHRAHFFGILPYLLLLACPLLHLFMHGKHGGHGDGRGDQTDRPHTRGHGHGGDHK
ncbi:MAG: DUF2933 domain-containing protein [Acidobacteria bacterium]|nr:DUF2933 domain-containing protein [Acidobacteriota bacterium]